MKKFCIVLYAPLLMGVFIFTAPSNVVAAEIIASSSDTIFGYPHGTMKIPAGIVIGTVRENPGQIVIFPDPNNLTEYIATTTAGFMDLADVDYDKTRHKLYFVSSRIDNHHLEILSVDPKTLAWKPVFEFPGVSGIGYSTINTDGTSIYVATQSNPAYLLKIKIADWTLQASRVFTSLGTGFHSAEFHQYSNHSELYVDTFSNPSQFFKVNTISLKATSTILQQSYNITDDAYFRPINDQGGLMYVASESGGGMDVIDTAHMTSTHYAAPNSYGVFSDGTNLYSVNPDDHGITKYPNFNIANPIFMSLPNLYRPNEWFSSLTGTGYFTTFASSSALYKYSEK